MAFRKKGGVFVHIRSIHSSCVSTHATIYLNEPPQRAGPEHNVVENDESGGNICCKVRCSSIPVEKENKNNAKR